MLPEPLPVSKMWSRLVHTQSPLTARVKSVSWTRELIVVRGSPPHSWARSPPQLVGMWTETTSQRAQWPSGSWAYMHASPLLSRVHSEETQGNHWKRSQEFRCQDIFLHFSCWQNLANNLEEWYWMNGQINCGSALCWTGKQEVTKFFSLTCISW